MGHDENIKRLIDAGLSLKSAEVVIDCFETADQYGVTTHGISMLDSHIDRIRKGGYNLKPTMKIIRETPAFALIDGENGMGPVVANYCMEFAIKKAKKVGVYTVLSRNNNTFGPAFCYPMKAAKQGLIGFVCSNSPAQMAPSGGIDKMLGTNPFAAVIPVKDSDPIIIDMSTSIVAKSKFKEYSQKGVKLPDGWAVDSNGNPTNDPDVAIQGLVLPMAGFKGYAISMLIDIISGVLSGAAYLNHVGRFYNYDGKSMNVGFYMMAIDPKVVFDGNYEETIASFVNDLRKSRVMKGSVISLPGDDRIKYRRENYGKTNCNF